MTPSPSTDIPRRRRFVRGTRAALTAALPLSIAATICAAPAQGVPSQVQYGTDNGAGSVNPSIFQSQPRGLELGVESQMSWRDYPYTTQQLDLLQQSGTRWMRMDVSWASLQEYNGDNYSQWYIDRLDRIVREAKARNIKILGTILGAPSWMGHDAGRPGLPYSPDALAKPAEMLARRYAGTIDAWEIWNEPDCSDAKCSVVDPARYVPLLKAGYRGVKAGNPNATVVTAGFSGINIQWLRAFYDAGAQGNFDALGVHPYLAPANGSPRLQPAGTNPYRITNVPAAAALMASRGDGGKPIWFTEFGWTTGRQWGAYDGVDELTQAFFLRDAVRLVNSDYPQVTHMFWYMLHDRNDAGVYEDGFGLLRLDNSPKPAYWSLKEAQYLVSGRWQ